MTLLLKLFCLKTLLDFICSDIGLSEGYMENVQKNGDSDEVV